MLFILILTAIIRPFIFYWQYHTSPPCVCITVLSSLLDSSRDLPQHRPTANRTLPHECLLCGVSFLTAKTTKKNTQKKLEWCLHKTNLAKIFITIVIVDINKPLMQFFIVIGWKDVLLCYDLIFRKRDIFSSSKILC